MADQKSQFEILLKTVADATGITQIKTEIGTLNGQLSSLASSAKAAFGALGIGFGIQQLNQMANAALKTREELAAWTVQVLTSKDGSEQLVNELGLFNRQLSESTGISEKSIRNMESLFALYGASADQIKQLTHGTIELAAARRLDAETMAQFIARALTGEDLMLNRLGIRIDKEKSHADQVKQLIEQLGRIPDIAEKMEEASGGLGKLEIQTQRARNAFGDL